MGGNTVNFGSRTQFLPGDGSNEIDIKYQRYGGCFVTYKKGFLYVLLSLIIAGITGYVVYYYFGCHKRNITIFDSTEDILSEISSTAEKIKSEQNKSIEPVSKLSPDIAPLFYRLKIHPFLNENEGNKFSFEGQVSIVFQSNTPTKILIFNAKKLNISNDNISLTHTSTSQIIASTMEKSRRKRDTETETAAPDNVTLPPDSVNDVNSNNVTANAGSSDNVSENAVDLNNVTENAISPNNITENAVSLNTNVTENADSSNNDNKNAVSLDNVTENAVNSDNVSKNAGEENATTVTDNAEEASGRKNTIPIDEDSAEPLEPVSNSTNGSDPKRSATAESTVLKVAENNNVEISNIKFDEENEIYTITTKNSLQKAVNYTLSIKFNGEITDSPEGIFRTSYKAGNDTIWMVNTILEPSFARSLFPCFDEPQLKARYELSIARRTNMTSISNMILKNTYPVNNYPGWVWDHFEISPLMSPHSVGFSVFGFDSSKAAAPVPLPLTKLWGTEQVLKDATYIIKVAPTIIETCNKHFGYNYSLHKFDIVAVPNLPVPAVNAWGLIFIREDLVLVSDDLSSYRSKENMLSLLSQEVAKQWFGHIVTIKSWTNYWLTATIASYTKYIVMDKVEPNWNNLDQLPLIDREDVLDADTTLSKINTISASENADDEEKILLIKKGGLVLRDLNVTLNQEVFTKNLKDFVNSYKYKTFDESNFWTAFNTSNVTKPLPSSVTIKNMVDLWTTQEGFPLLNTTIDYENNVAEVKQYLYRDDDSPSNNVWILPFSSISGSDDKVKTEWLVDRNTKQILNDAVSKENNSWLLLNGPYLSRVTYDLNNWNSLTTVLNSKQDTLSVINRAKLIDDAFHLARSGAINYTIALDLSSYFSKSEKDFLPWETLLKNMEYLNRVLSKTANYGTFQDYLLKLLEPMFATIDPNKADYGKTYTESTLQRIILAWLCKFNHKPCRDWAYSQFEGSMNKNSTSEIKSDLRAIVYCVGVQMHGRRAWEFLWNRYSQMQNEPSEIKDLISGMACTTESWLIMKYLHRAIEEENTHYSILMWRAFSSEIAIDSAFGFLKDNWKKVHNKFQHSPFALKQVILGVLSQLSTKYDLDQVVYFFAKEKTDLEIFAPDILTVTKKLVQMTEWKNKYLSHFNSWVEKNIS